MGRTRKSLRAMDGVRARFRARFERYGTKRAYGGRTERTLLLRDVVHIDSGELVTEHVWFNLSARWQALGDLGAGDVIEFDARVKRYNKGYRGRRWDVVSVPSVDYKLAWPTKVVLAAIGGPNETRD